MGVTIESKNCSIDMGCSGFLALRTKVAELTAADIFMHYKDLKKGIFLTGDTRKEFFDKYNQKTEELDVKYHGNYSDILDFLYASDCGGELDVMHCKSIYEIIKDHKDNICYGYIGRSDCAMFADFVRVVKDGIVTGSGIEWC